jgi:hypothetical protein
MDDKQNRAYIGLPLNRKQMLSHVQLCQFSAGLTFLQLVNLMIYIHNLPLYTKAIYVAPLT